MSGNSNKSIRNTWNKSFEAYTCFINLDHICATSGFRRSIVNAFALSRMLQYVGSWLSMFRDSLFDLVESCKIGPIGCPETSVSKYQHTLLNIPDKQGFWFHLLITYICARFISDSDAQIYAMWLLLFMTRYSSNSALYIYVCGHSVLQQRHLHHLEYIPDNTLERVLETLSR